jgi:hypothetical protein
MAAGLGFKTFNTGDVLSAADTNGYLMQGVLVFANAAGRDAAITSPQEGQFAYLKDTNVTTYYTGSAWANLDTTGMTNPMTTTGDTIYSSSGSTPARLGIGTSGQVLTVSGGGVPSWTTPAGGGGKVLQVVTAFKSDTFAASDSAYQDITGLSVSITPSSATSKVLVMMTVTGSHQPTIADAVLRLVRNSTAIAVADSAGSRTLATVSLMADSTTSTDSTAFTFLDSPATTSATTYKVQGTGNGSTPKGFYINRGSLDTDVASVARTASSITVLEIGA